MNSPYFAGFYINYIGPPSLILTLCTCFFFGEILLKFVYQAFGFEAFLLELAKTMHKIKKCWKYYSPKIIWPGPKKNILGSLKVLKNLFLGPKIALSWRPRHCQTSWFNLLNLNLVPPHCVALLCWSILSVKMCRLFCGNVLPCIFKEMKHEMMNFENRKEQERGEWMSLWDLWAKEYIFKTDVMWLMLFQVASWYFPCVSQKQK